MARLRSLILTVAAAIGAFCILVFAVSLVFGLKPQIVVSGSMEPTLRTGSLILAKEVSAAEIEVGDIVTVPQPRGDGLITHRVTSIEQQYSNWQITMRGDANAADDPQPYVVRSVGKMVVNVPWVGYLAGLFRTPFGITGIVVFGLAVVFTYLWRPRERPKDAPESVDSVAPAEAAATPRDIAQPPRPAPEQGSAPDAQELFKPRPSNPL